MRYSKIGKPITQGNQTIIELKSLGETKHENRRDRIGLMNYANSCVRLDKIIS